MKNVSFNWWNCSMPIEMKIKIAKYLSLPFNSISKKFYRSHFVELIGPTVNNWGHSTIEYSIPQIMHASNASPARANYSSFQSVISFNIDESRVVLLHTRVEQKNSIFILRLPHETETRNIWELFARTFRSIVSCVDRILDATLACVRSLNEIV